MKNTELAMSQTLNNNYKTKSNMKTKSEFKIFWIAFISLTVMIVYLLQSSFNFENPIEGENNSKGIKKIETKESLTESDCLRLYGTAPDMSAWELAQAECMLQQNDYKTACDCMTILSK